MSTGTAIHSFQYQLSVLRLDTATVHCFRCTRGILTRPRVIRGHHTLLLDIRCTMKQHFSDGLFPSCGRAQSGGLVAKLPVHSAIYISWFSYSSGSAALEICKRARLRDTIGATNFESEWDQRIAGSRSDGWDQCADTSAVVFTAFKHPYPLHARLGEKQIPNGFSHSRCDTYEPCRLE
ncbi:hypothetical protein ALC62_02452 [Cyphomyrmex costatus]|uniref:Uncharacterized protein n=1 Tax=Cyphomyrmex costatus TaxID=456900 RepID=A0A195D115_9HYME|nr:hypothetical protein ALC62_02452 [Cyphomyrmex costatus]